MNNIRIHRHSTGAQGALVNAYLVETGDGVVAVDGTLTVSDGRALRTRLEELGQPLLAVLVTHALPDHYGGIIELVAGDDVPIVATAGLERELPAEATLQIGHGGPVTATHFRWQREYIETFVGAVRAADWQRPEAAKAEVIDRMMRFLPTDDLRFLMELSIEPVAERLGIVATA